MGGVRNVDKIKQLEHEIGRRDKKISDQAKELEKLNRQLEQARAGSMEVQAVVDATLTAVVLARGVDAEDPDKPGTVLGKRMEIPAFNVKEMREKYEIHARRDEKGGLYVLGVVPREGK